MQTTGRAEQKRKGEKSKQELWRIDDTRTVRRAAQAKDKQAERCSPQAHPGAKCMGLRGFSPSARLFLKKRPHEEIRRPASLVHGGALSMETGRRERSHAPGVRRQMWSNSARLNRPGLARAGGCWVALGFSCVRLCRSDFRGKGDLWYAPGERWETTSNLHPFSWRASLSGGGRPRSHAGPEPGVENEVHGRTCGQRRIAEYHRAKTAGRTRTRRRREAGTGQRGGGDP